MNCIHIDPKSLVRLLTVFRDHGQFLFTQLVDIVAVDYLDRKERFEVIYHLLSHKYNQRLFVKINVADNQPVQTLCDVFVNANWYEREVFDLMGIYFLDHPDLRRLLTDYQFSGHPLRKDFPLSGYTQVYYNKKEGKVDSEPVHFTQDYRDFDYISNWESVLNNK
ncbi:MAG: NADH-quinone oxidoreductase subunit C [Proteobacteria bacterium]|nr:NADH-quinone oxidoreductase subunit C [Pseudomonadota bacterium]